MVRSKSHRGNKGTFGDALGQNNDTVSTISTVAAAAAVDEKFVVRSLRRRLCKAFQDEDSVAAHKYYTATRTDWEELVCQEIEVAVIAAEKERLRQSAWEEEQRNKRGARGTNPIRGLIRRKQNNNVTLDVSHTHHENPIELQSLASIFQKTNSSNATVVFSPNSKVDSSPTNEDPNTQGVLQQHLNPSDAFDPDDYKSPFDEYETENFAAQEALKNFDESASGPEFSKKDKFGRRLRRNRNNNATARQAFSFFQRRSSSDEEQFTPAASAEDTTTFSDGEVDQIHIYQNPEDITTPLHEAARIGNGELVRTMLAAAGTYQPLLDCNVRNGLGRTVLHCVAGGVTRKEANRYRSLQQRRLVQSANRRGESNESISSPVDPDGIRVPKPLKAVVNDAEATAAGMQTEQSASAKAKKAAHAVGRFLREGLKHKNKKQQSESDPSEGDSQDIWKEQSEIMKDEEYHQLQQDRADVAETILSWSHPDDGSDQAGIGISSNAVDNQNRTALHYAAALGRTDICMSLCNYFGTMLTIVDSVSQTPCELAGVNQWDELAAQLEARALLYIDPYGTDEELLSSFSDPFYQNDDGITSNMMPPPFSWFETFNMDGIQQKREHLISQALERLHILAIKKRAMQNTRAAILEHGANLGSDDGDFDNSFKIDATKADDCDIHMMATNSLEEESPQSIAQRMICFDSIHESHVELFLTYHKWDVKKALEAFFDDPFAAFMEANVPIPKKEITGSTIESKKSDEEALCLICCDEFETNADDWIKLDGCKHAFCKECLGEYLLDCAKSRSTGCVIRCPHHECDALLSPDELQNLCPSIGRGSEVDAYDMLQSAANENFIMSDQEFRFCPHPGCGRAVRFNSPSFGDSTKLIGSGLLELVGAVCTAVNHVDSLEGADNSYALTYEGVNDPNYFTLTSQPKRAHRFCFKCGEEGIHWPVPCEKLSEWNDTIEKEIEDVKEGGEDYKDVAQKLWMKANTRPCPKCNAPIEKNEGCNHMTCRNPSCKHEFCWICRNDWKLHNSETGGFFRCNRWVEDKGQPEDDIPPEDMENARVPFFEDINDPRTMEVTYGTAMYDTRKAKKKAKEMARFLHHYQRWNAHAESATLERNMEETVCARLAPVVHAAIDFSGNEFIFGGKGLSFVHAAFTELLECRSMLQHSYAMSYFRYKSMDVRKYRLLRRRASEKMAFEQFQSELELMTEQISDIVARSHLRASQTQIMFLTKATSEKRKEFSNVMINILVEEKEELEAELRREAAKKQNAAHQNQRLALPGGMLDIISGTQNGSDETNHLENGVTEVELAVRQSLDRFLSESGSNDILDDDDDDEAVSDWACPACTYVNDGGRRCAMCGTRRS